MTDMSYALDFGLGHWTLDLDLDLNLALSWLGFRNLRQELPTKIQHVSLPSSCTIGSTKSLPLMPSNLLHLLTNALFSHRCPSPSWKPTNSLIPNHLSFNFNFIDWSVSFFLLFLSFNILTATIPILLVMCACARELLHFAQLDKATQWGRAYCLLVFLENFACFGKCRRRKNLDKGLLNGQSWLTTFNM